MLLPKVLAKSKHFEPTAHVQDLAEYASPIVSCGNQTGEGWFLTGEMLELINEGVTNIICAQPFACLPNHIVSKGVIKSEYYGAAEPPVRCGESHLSGLTEPLRSL